MQAVNPVAKIWAFVSVTSNHTQNVSIVTPDDACPVTPRN